MTHQCAACGTTFSDADICPNCQLPVKPPELSAAQPSASAMPVADAGQTSAEVAGLGGKASKPKKLRLPLVVGIGVASLALVAGVAFAGVKLFAPGGALGGPVQLVVTGEPPSTAGNWANGVKEVWRVSGTHSAYGEQLPASSFNGSGTSTASSWSLGDSMGGDVLVGRWAYDSNTGQLNWADSGSSSMDMGPCEKQDNSEIVVCISHSQERPQLAFVNWKTGKVQHATSLSSLGIDVSAVSGGELQIVDGDVFAALEPGIYGPPSDEPPESMVLARISNDGKKAKWVKRYLPCYDKKWKGPYWPSRSLYSLHGAVFTKNGLAVDFATGSLLVADTQCVTTLTPDVLLLRTRDGAAVGGTVKAPDGATFLTTDQWTDFAPTFGVLPKPLRLTDVQLDQNGNKGTAGLTAFDPTTGAASWSSPLDVQVSLFGGTYMNGSMGVHEDTMYIVDGDTRLRAVDVATGRVRWTHTFPEDSYPSLLDASGGALLVGEINDTEAIDLQTGAVLWSLDGLGDLVPNQQGTMSLLYVAHDAPYLARLDPADRPTKALSVPSSAPACPAGMTAVSWTQYSDGGILLCHADQKYAVVYPSHPDWQAAQLNFTGGGHEVVFSNGARVRVSLGGSVVYTDADGKTTTQTATEAWNNATGEVKVSVPKDLKTCPADSWPISLSTYNGGWLLVCGTNADAPTSMVYNDGSRTSELGSVSYRNGGYCGTGDVGTVCGYRAPAVVSVTDASGKVTQHSVGGNYFDDHGAGGAGQGTGSYGVEAPTDTAKDQVRYLTQILQKSAAGRANLNAAVAQVRSCSDVAGAVTTINGVIANRQELLDALASTPVDAVPNGSQLVAKLRNALDLSLKSDQVWLQWAQAEQSNSCAEGENSATYKQVETMNESVATAKDAFVAAWNSQIAATYKAPRFATSQI